MGNGKRKKMGKFFQTADFQTRMLLTASVLTGLVLTLVHALFSVDMYRDSANVYSAMARALAAGDFSSAFHPGIPSLNVLLSGVFSFFGMAPERALSLVSGLFYVGTVPFLFLLLKQFLPERLSAVGALLFACAPKVIRFSCSAVIDSGKIFFLVAALFFLHRLMKKQFRAPLTGVLFGAALGGLSLARSEGVGIAGILAGCAVVCFIRHAVRMKTFPSPLSAVTAAAAWGLCIFSRVVLMRCATGTFVYDRRIEDGISDVFNRLTGGHAAGAAVSLPPASPRVSWFDLVNQNIRGGYELYLIFAAVGLLLLILAARWKGCGRLFPGKTVPDDVKWDNFFYILLITVVGNALVFKASDIAAYRYFLLDIPLLMVFTVTGISWVWQWGEKFICRRVLFCAAALILLLQVVNGATYFFSCESRRQYACGRKVAELLHAEKNSGRVWFREACIEWYHSGMRRAWPIETASPDVRTFADFDYALWGERESGVDVLASRKDLREIALPAGSAVRLFERIR